MKFEFRDSKTRVLFQNLKPGNTIKVFSAEIEKINPKPDEVIVWSIPFGRFSISEIKEMQDSIQLSFPNNKVIGIPDASTLKSCGKDVLENIMSLIATVLEEMGY